MDIDSLLKPFQRFGVHLGLERIQRLLADLGNPHHSVPIIHVAGTNGKGSVCAYLSAVLTEAGYRTGRYTSPHLVDWTERLCLNEQPISTEAIEQLLLQVKAAIPEECEDSPTQFEVITAAAWLYFAQQQVDIAVIEVGLGGRLDATNVSNSPLVTIITSISREHWQHLGPTLADIAREKAGILKAGCPAVIGQLPSEAKAVVEQRIKELGCPTLWVKPAKRLEEGWADYQDFEDFQLNPKSKIVRLSAVRLSSPSKPHAEVQNPKSLRYPLPLLGDIQLMNSAIAIASLQILQQRGWKIPDEAIQNGMAKTHWLGRLQWTTWQNHRLLIDGAHNPAAALALRHYVDTLNTSVTWVMGMLSTKDHVDIFKALLRNGDRLYIVPIPDHSSADPDALATLAQTLYPELADCRTYPNLEAGLQAATSYSAEAPENLIILCGSLYLVGHFLQINH